MKCIKLAICFFDMKITKKWRSWRFSYLFFFNIKGIKKWRFGCLFF